MSNVQQITPFLHVPNLAKALDLFTRILRFDVKFRMSDYAYLACDGAAIRILEEPSRALPSPGEKLRMTVYIDVRDVDGLYAELLPGLSTLPVGDVHAPMDKPWDQRDMCVCRMVNG